MVKKIRALAKCPRRGNSAEPSEGAREKIKNAALKLFAERGLDGVSVRDISSETCLNLSLVSYYFGGKEGLYETILAEHISGVRSSLIGIIEHFQNLPASREIFTEEIRLIVKTLVEMRMASPEIAQIMQRERLDGLPHTRKIYEEMMGPLGDQLIGLVEKAQEQGVVRKDLNARAYFICLTESLFGYFIFHDCKVSKIFKDAFKFPKDKDAFIDHLVLIYTQGVFA